MLLPILAVLAMLQTGVPTSPGNVPSVARLIIPPSLIDVQPESKPARVSVTVFYVLVVEGGWVGHPVPVTITATGEDSDRVLKQILERLGQKPATPKP